MLFGTLLGGQSVEKVRAIVARRTFGRQNVKNTPGWDHFGRRSVVSQSKGQI